ncbi:MAG: 16S rRNA (guanine(527)-N(7))-methyltransferase RsmG [Lachnospiraceae bacterium]|nr:16S rRNA (guanine(527)-N(7))-methyltransferase RsmG [Lachnospiraceae bacterium]
MEKYFSQFHIELTEVQKRQFLLYYQLLIQWNDVMNLTAITDFDEVCEKHFADSISLVNVLDVSKCSSMVDVGTGAGFPGIPLKIVFPHLEVTLIDSLQKRVNFLNEVIRQLNLENINALHGRAEDFAHQIAFREKYDLCVSRAVANMNTLSEYCLPFVKTGGVFVPYKSQKGLDEIDNATKAITVLGGKYQGKTEFLLGEEYRVLFAIEKIKPTPKKYPRKAGLPAKDPLFPG